MAIFDIPQITPRPTKNPQTPHPGLEPRIGDVPRAVETTASRKVDDLSRHESKHDMAPKHEPKLNAREKGFGSAQPAGAPAKVGKAPKGTTKK